MSLSSSVIVRADEYRSRASFLARQAAAALDPGIKLGLLDVATNYLRMARYIEDDADADSDTSGLDCGKPKVTAGDSDAL